MKKCGHCGEVKPYSEFGRDKKTATGYASRCFVCQREAVRESYQRHREKTLAKRREYREANRDAIRARDREYHRQNRDRIKLQRRDWYERSTHVWKAGKAIQNAIEGGRMSPATEHVCAVCHKQAEAYHHPSYMADDRLNVIPVCVSCHRYLHERQEHPAWGAVALRMGKVRIAITGSQPEERAGICKTS